MAEPEWKKRAACRDMGPEVVLAFHDYALETGEPGERMLWADETFCVGCPVRTECLEDAWVRRETGGMRAGATPAMLRWLMEKTRRPRCTRCRTRLALLDMVEHWTNQRGRCPACRARGDQEGARA